MNFLLTTFFARLDEPMPLLASPALVLENLTDTDECERARRLFRRAVHLDGESVRIIPGLAAHATWPPGLGDLRRQIRELPEGGGIPADLGYELLDRLADEAIKDLVVCRFDDEGQAAYLKAETAELGADSFIMLDSDAPLISGANRAFRICNLMGLLVDDEKAEDSGGIRKSFLLGESLAWSAELGDNICRSLLNHGLYSIDDRGATGFEFTDLDFFQDRLIQVARLIDQRLAESDDNVILYSAELLSVATHSPDIRTSIVNLVGLLELVLTRNPDSSRFNVEDSLAKQFVLKVGTALHLADPARDMGRARSALRDLYSIRSAIAHGDFEGLPKKLGRSVFAEPDDSETSMFTRLELELDAVRSFAYECAKDVLLLALSNPGFTKFLKAG